MKKKMGSIVLIIMLVAISLQFISIKDPNAIATFVGQNGNYLDFNYLHNFISNLSYIIHDQTVYGPGEIKKGRYFGSAGNLKATDMVYLNFTRECGFNSEDVRKVKLENVDGTKYDYSELVEVTASQLIINHPDFLDETTLSQTAILQDDYYPIAAVRSNITDPLKSITMDSTFNDIYVINEADYFQLFPKCEIGINPINLSYSPLNDCNITLGNITYVASGEEIPAHPLQTVFLLDEEQGVEHQIENATNASGIILLKNTSRAYTFQNASNYCLPILRVDTEDEANNQNITIVKQLLENGSSVIADSTIYSDKITFIHNLSSPLCTPDCDFFVLFNFTNSDSWRIIKKCTGLYVRDILAYKHGWSICRGIIINDNTTDTCHNMFPQAISNPRFLAFVEPAFALPGYSVNTTVGGFLWRHSGEEEDNTISGYINQVHHQETAEEPGVEAYNVEADLTIAHSPNDAIVLLSSRYDAMWNECPGDSGAGNGIIMGVAKYMQMLNQSGIKPKYNVTFLMTTNEENGCYGAQFYSDSHPDDNITRWIGTDQLGFTSGELYNVYKNPDDRSVVDNITKLLEYHNKTGYNTTHILTSYANHYFDYGIPIYGDYGVGAEDVVFFDRGDCDTILIHKDDWPLHHRRGLNLTYGDVINESCFDKNDINMSYNITWATVKYFLYNPNCWFSTKNYEAVDSNGGTIPDSLKATFTIKSVLPNDCVLVNASLYDASTEQLVPGEYQEMTLVVNRTGVEHNVTFTMPPDVKEGDYYMKLEVYNSTARINRLAGLDFSTNDSNTSSMFHLNRYHTLGDIRIGSMSKNVNNIIRGSKFTPIENALVWNITAYVSGGYNPAPTYQCLIYRVSDGQLMGASNQVYTGTAAWKTFTFSPKPVLLKNTQYVLCIWGNSQNAYVNATSTSYVNDYQNGSCVFGNPPQHITWDWVAGYNQLSIFCRYTLNLPPEIINVSNSPDTIGFGYNVTINANVTDDYNNTIVKVNITYPDQTFGNYSMSHITGNHYRYVFNNTWLVNQYNYTVWAIDNASNVDCSPGYHFHVSASASMSIATLKDSYSGNQYINITDPPNLPESYILLGRGLTWNTYYDTSSGNNILETYQGPVNYQENNGSWTPINNSFYLLPNNHPAYSFGYRTGNTHGLFGVYFKSDISSAWPVAFTYNRSSNPTTDVIRSKLVGVGYLDPQSDWAYHYLQSAQSSQGQTNSNTITYPNVFTGTDVSWVYRNTELKEAITLSNTTKTLLQNHPPSMYGLNDASSYLVFITKLDYQNLNLYNASGMLNGNVTITDAGVDFKDVLGQFKCGLPVGEAWELNNESVREKLTYRVVHLNGDTYLLSGLRVSDLNAMIFPVVIDPTLTVYSRSSDGHINKSDSNYNTARTAQSGTVSSFASFLSLGQIKDTSGPPSKTYSIYRGFVFFNTSSLPSNAYLDSAKLSLYKKDDFSATDFDITIQNGQPTYPHEPMQSSDYSLNYYSGNGGTLNTRNLQDGYNNISLTNLGWINKNGITKLCLRSSRDINGNAPTGNEYVNVYANEQGSGYQLKLVIVYRNQSKIKNTGLTNVKGYLLIQVQFYNSTQGKWLVDKDTINETSPRTITSGNQLALDTIFNGHVRASELSHGAGTYRVYAAWRDPNGNILKTSSSVELKAWWQFTKT